MLRQLFPENRFYVSLDIVGQQIILLAILLKLDHIWQPKLL